MKLNNDINDENTQSVFESSEVKPKEGSKERSIELLARYSKRRADGTFFLDLLNESHEIAKEIRANKKSKGEIKLKDYDPAQQVVLLLDKFYREDGNHYVSELRGVAEAEDFPKLLTNNQTRKNGTMENRVYQLLLRKENMYEKRSVALENAVRQDLSNIYVPQEIEQLLGKASKDSGQKNFFSEERKYRDIAKFRSKVEDFIMMILPETDIQKLNEYISDDPQRWIKSYETFRGKGSLFYLRDGQKKRYYRSNDIIAGGESIDSISAIIEDKSKDPNEFYRYISEGNEELTQVRRALARQKTGLYIDHKNKKAYTKSTIETSGIFDKLEELGNQYEDLYKKSFAAEEQDPFKLKATLERAVAEGKDLRTLEKYEDFLSTQEGQALFPMFSSNSDTNWKSGGKYYPKYDKKSNARGWLKSMSNYFMSSLIDSGISREQFKMMFDTKNSNAQEFMAAMYNPKTARQLGFWVDKETGDIFRPGDVQTEMRRIAETYNNIKTRASALGETPRDDTIFQQIFRRKLALQQIVDNGISVADKIQKAIDYVGPLEDTGRKDDKEKVRGMIPLLREAENEVYTEENFQTLQEVYRRKFGVEFARKDGQDIRISIRAISNHIVNDIPRNNSFVVDADVRKVLAGQTSIDPIFQKVKRFEGTEEKVSVNDYSKKQIDAVKNLLQKLSAKNTIPQKDKLLDLFSRIKDRDILTDKEREEAAQLIFQTHSEVRVKQTPKDVYSRVIDQLSESERSYVNVFVRNTNFFLPSEISNIRNNFKSNFDLASYEGALYEGERDYVNSQFSVPESLKQSDSSKPVEKIASTGTNEQQNVSELEEVEEDWPDIDEIVEVEESQKSVKQSKPPELVDPINTNEDKIPPVEVEEDWPDIDEVIEEEKSVNAKESKKSAKKESGHFFVSKRKRTPSQTKDTSDLITFNTLQEMNNIIDIIESKFPNGFQIGKKSEDINAYAENLRLSPKEFLKLDEDERFNTFMYGYTRVDAATEYYHKHPKEIEQEYMALLQMINKENESNMFDQFKDMLYGCGIGDEEKIKLLDAVAGQYNALNWNHEGDFAGLSEEYNKELYGFIGDFAKEHGINPKGSKYGRDIRFKKTYESEAHRTTTRKKQEILESAKKAHWGWKMNPLLIGVPAIAGLVFFANQNKKDDRYQGGEE